MSLQFHNKQEFLSFLSKNGISLSGLTSFTSQAAFNASLTAGTQAVGQLSTGQLITSGDGIHSYVAEFTTRNTVVGTGDSIMRCQGSSYNGMSFMEYAAVFSNGAIKVEQNYGVNGNKTSDILARLSTDALTSSAQYVMVMEVTNDAINSISVATHRSNMTAIINEIITAGKTPIIVGGPPQNSWDTWKYNFSDQVLCDSLGVKYINPWSACTANGQWIDTTWSIDGTHPTPKALRTAGQALWGMLQNMFIGSADLTWTNNDPDGMLSNGCFLANVANVPTGWTGAAGVTHAIVAGTGAEVGNWWQQTITNQTAWQISTYSGISFPSGWLVGDNVRLSCRVKTTGFEANGSSGNGSYPTEGKLGAQLTFTWGGTSVQLMMRAINADVNGVYSVDGVIPAGAGATSTFQLAITPIASAAVSGVFSIAQLQIHNLSLAGRM